MTMMVMKKLMPFSVAVFRSAIVRIMLIMMTMAMVLMMITSKDKLPLLRGVFVSANVLMKKRQFSGAYKSGFSPGCLAQV